MKHFLTFLVVVFATLFIAVLFRSNKSTKPILRVYGKSSFISQWGPGPWLKEKFEKTCDCKVDYFDSADSLLLIQRLKSEAKSYGADLVLGFDQYDLEMAQAGFEWKKINTDGLALNPLIEKAFNRSALIPYDWGVMAFLARKSDFQQLPKSFDDLLKLELKTQIAVPDPRTSSTGLQFLLWLIHSKGEEQAFTYLRQFNKQVKAYTNSWSMANGLFQKSQVKSYFSYTSSPVYYLTEEKNSDVVALEFSEGHPLQFEYMGIPSACRNCDLAEKFAEMILSVEGQKVIMEKNYMFPVIEGVKEGTPFAQVPNYSLTEDQKTPSAAERERLLKKWSQMRRVE